MSENNGNNRYAKAREFISRVIDGPPTAIDVIFDRYCVAPDGAAGTPISFNEFCRAYMNVFNQVFGDIESRKVRGYISNSLENSNVPVSRSALQYRYNMSHKIPVSKREFDKMYALEFGTILCETVCSIIEKNRLQNKVPTPEDVYSELGRMNPNLADKGTFDTCIVPVFQMLSESVEDRRDSSWESLAVKMYDDRTD